MKKKLRLNLEDISVESFETSPSEAQRVTVHGASGIAWISCVLGDCCGEIWPSQHCTGDGDGCTIYGCDQHGYSEQPCGHSVQGSCPTYDEMTCNVTCGAGCGGGTYQSCGAGCTTTPDGCDECI